MLRLVVSAVKSLLNYLLPRQTCCVAESLVSSSWSRSDRTHELPNMRGVEQQRASPLFSPPWNLLGIRLEHLLLSSFVKLEAWFTA